jgi:hypothetical protein
MSVLQFDEWGLIADMPRTHCSDQTSGDGNDSHSAAVHTWYVEARVKALLHTGLYLHGVLRQNSTALVYSKRCSKSYHGYRCLPSSC